ncbi:MAG: exo-alpha-sialidase [Rhodospirillales bacterium]|jgi:predicted neuraminidase|nr:exo-alpha-sialidase [Rhodospirillales bacterium]
MLKEFVFERAPFPSAHASTIAETARGLACAFFGGSREGAPDVSIWICHRQDGRWSEPRLVATGEQRLFRRYPCWNPVLYQEPDGPLLLFYKVGPSPSRWWGRLMRSADGGHIWSDGERLPDGILGPIKNKPVRVADGTLLCPSSAEHDGWRVHMEWTRDGGESWYRTPPLNDRQPFKAIQPTILSHRDGSLQILCRTRQGAVAECWSRDGGRTWSAMQATLLPNPDSGIDGVTLDDGRSVLVYNHAASGRTPLNLAVSDDGRRWQALAVLEDDGGEFSYPAIIAGTDGALHITYTWNRRTIRYVRLDIGRLRPHPLSEHGAWPEAVCGPA